MRYFAALLLTCLAPGAAHAQAFGVDLGSDVKKYAPESTGIDLFFRIEPPQPYIEFDSYTAPVDPEGHICSISGLGKNYDYDATGTRAKEAFAKLKTILEGKYGKVATADEKKPGSLDSLFQRDIESGARTYEARWDGSDLPSGVAQVTLSIEAIDTGATYLVLNYQGVNFLECMQRRQKADTTGL